ncbi:unnamed protein product [Rotaria sp. Silwood1]|nr:unnamed protein product [Rotaria sp. Silwood1]
MHFWRGPHICELCEACILGICEREDLTAMGHADIVRILCEHGANVTQQYHLEGKDITAYDLAESLQRDHVCQVLKSFDTRQSLHCA